MRNLTAKPYSDASTSGPLRPWLEHLEATLSACGLPVFSTTQRTVEEERLLKNSLACVLLGQAREAYLQWEREAALDDKHLFHQWEGVKELLHNHFGTRQLQAEARRQLQQLRQGSMSVGAYADKFMQLLSDCRYAPNTSAIDGQVLVAQFELGLGVAGRTAIETKRNVIASLGQQRELTLAEAIAAARAADLSHAAAVPQPSTPAATTSTFPQPMELGAVSAHHHHQQQQQPRGVVFPAEFGALMAMVASMNGLQWDGGRFTSRNRSPPPDPRQHPRWPRYLKRSDADMERLRAEQRCFVCEESTHRWLECQHLPDARQERRQRTSSPSQMRQRSPERRSASPNGRRPY
jgi:hypothetical protein